MLASTTALCALRDEAFCQLTLVAALVHDGGSEEDPETTEKALGMFRELMRARKGKRNGWLRFCDEIGVDPDALTKPFLDGTEWVMQSTEAAWEALEADCDEGPSDADELAARELEALRDAWRDRYD